MKENKNTLSQGLRQWLTEPAIEIVEPGQRRQVRLLATLLIVMILLDVLTILVVSPMTAGFGSHSVREPIFLLDLGLIVVFGFAYALSRTRHYRWGMVLTLITTWVIPYLAAVSSNEARVLLMYTAMVVLLGSVFLGTWGLALLAVIVSASISFFPVLRPDATLQVLSIPLFFVAVTSVLIIVFVRHRDLVEQDRQVELAQANLIVENSPVVLFRWKAAEGWPVELVSQNVIQFGYTPQKLLSGAVPYARLVHPDDLERIARETHEYSASGVDHYQREYRIVAKDGQVRWVDDRTTVERDADGNITHYQGIVVDITERKHAEAALRESEEKMRSIFRAAPTGIGVVVNRVLKEVNQRLGEITGYSRDELIDQSARMVYPSDEDYEYVGREKYRQIAEGGTGTVETRFRRKDGTVIDVLLSSTPIDTTDLSRGVTFTALDITERKRAEVALRASEERYRSLFERTRALLEAIPDMIFEFARDGTFLYFAPAPEVRPYALPEQFIGEKIGAVMPPHVATLAQEAISRALDTDQVQRIEYQLPEGEQRRDYEVRLVASGADRVMSIVRDITERKRAEAEREKLIQELENQNAELERFTYTVSHDLKAPLITIRGFLGFVEKDAREGNVERLKSDMARIVEATDKMNRLLGELLELSRIGRMMNPPQAAPFETIAREALRLAHGRIQERGVLVTVAPDLPIVCGDRARLVEVVQNLVDNACKFMGTQPKPHIEIGQRGAQADGDGNPIFFVRDNGMGIDPKFLDQVFGLFNKLDPKSEGTGVGLALVKRIVEVHGGKIWVESEGIGKGTTFYFTLPTTRVSRNKPSNNR